ncbi:MAG: M28 family peptidase [Pirellulaceae bacterium]|nr:M28 family peptidase [Pirellulaceae bacterium]
MLTMTYTNPQSILVATLFIGWLTFSGSLEAETPIKIPDLQSTTDGSSEQRLAQARIASDVEFLSADEMRGRGPGTGGLDRAADFIAQRWKDLSLNTELFDGSPFQNFTIPGSIEASKPDKNRLRWRFGESEASDLTLDRDFRPLSLGSSGSFSGPLVFVGYGISANEKNLHYDEYAGIDVRGKVVIVLRKEPRQSDPDSPFDGTQSSRHALFATKLSTAIRYGASAIIFVNDALSFEKSYVSQDRDAEEAELLPGIEDAGKSNTAKVSIPTLFVTRRVVDGWLHRVRADISLTGIEHEIDIDLKPRSFEIDHSMLSGEVLLEKSTMRVKNVIASIDGRGGLANETVVIGAHYDHVGMGGPGSLAPGTIEIHNGADDNASGTAALLEIARLFSAQRNDSDTRRRLLFIAFTGEERGLLGSRHYVAHPRFAIESTIAMVNLDMVGRMRDRQLIVFGIGSSSRFDSFIDQASQGLNLNIRKQKEALGPSDHQPFFELRVPVLHLFTGLHSDYHRPSDDFEKINSEGIVHITDIVYQLGSRLTKQPERPDYIKVKGRANIRLELEQANRDIQSK